MPLACRAGNGLVRVDATTPQVVLYDNYFSSCKMALVVGSDSLENYTYALALTFDEGDIELRRGAKLSFLFRNKTMLDLYCASSAGRADVKYRRFKDAKVRIVTYYFHLTDGQLAQLMDEETYGFRFETKQGTVEKRIKNVKEKFIKLFNML